MCVSQVERTNSLLKQRGRWLVTLRKNTKAMHTQQHQGKEKYKKIGIFETLILLIFAERCNKNVVKDLILIKFQSLRTCKANYLYSLLKFHNLLLFCGLCIKIYLRIASLL
jgi:hypothetical protein